MTGISDDEIRVKAGANTTGINLNINSGSVSGVRDGVLAQNESTSPLTATTITVDNGANVTGSDVSHIWLFSLSSSYIIMTSVAIGLAAGYSHQSYAGNCSAVVAGASTCGGAANAGSDLPQIVMSTTSLFVTTSTDFSINATGDALTLTATGDLSFSHMSGGSITGITNGINAANNGTGALLTTTTGTVVGGSSGISSTHASSSGDLTIRAHNVTTTQFSAIFVQNTGNGAVSITTTGAVRVKSSCLYALVGAVSITTTGAVRGKVGDNCK